MRISKKEIINRAFVKSDESAEENQKRIKKAFTTSHNINLTKLTRAKTACIIDYVNQN